MASASAGMSSQPHEWYALASTEVVWMLRTLKEASRLVAPIGALYTPLKEKPDTPLLQFEPVTCKQPCRSVLNPFWSVFTMKFT
jgi:hypothetical protein